MYPFRWFRSKRHTLGQGGSDKSSVPPCPSSEILKQYQDETIQGDTVQTVNFIYNTLCNSEDFVMRKFKVFSTYTAVIFYLSSLSDESLVNSEILKPLMNTRDEEGETGSRLADHRFLTHLSEKILYQCQIRYENKLGKLIDAILQGQAVIVVEHMNDAIIAGSRQMNKRAIEQPGTEQVVQGPREGFIESLDTNLTLIRYRLPTADLRIQTMRLGRYSKSKTAICYIDGLVNPELVDEVNRRLSGIEIDAILDAGYIEQFIQDNQFTPFPQIQYTERPDKAVANLMEGRVIILVDGSPFALIVPTVFVQFFQTTEDYSSRMLQGNFVRFVRVVALIFSLIFPALYVAVISFNPELIPTEFAVAVAGGRAGVPFPSVVEVLIMEVSMEVLREATIRLPQQVGGALSIVGVLVIGQAAVSAGFANPITVVVVALTTIGSFATPAYTAAFALRMLRFPLIILAGMFGLYGVMVGLIFICNHLLSLRSFGVPYMVPAAPFQSQGMKDFLFRFSLWKMKKRPEFVQSPSPDRDRKRNANKKNALDPVQNKQAGDQDGNQT